MKYLVLLIIFAFLIYEKLKDKKNLIENGNVIFKTLNDSYTLDDLMIDLKKNDIYSLEEVEKAYLKNKKLIVKTKKPHIIIYNGLLDISELKKINKEEKYILDILKDKNLKMKEVLYAIYLNNIVYITIAK